MAFLHEVTVLMTSPSREHVKLRFTNGKSLWARKDTYQVEEVLRGSMAVEEEEPPPAPAIPRALVDFVSEVLLRVSKGYDQPKKKNG